MSTLASSALAETHKAFSNKDVSVPPGLSVNYCHYSQSMRLLMKKPQPTEYNLCLGARLSFRPRSVHLGHPAESALSRTQLASAAWLRAGQLGRQLGWAECGLSCSTPAEL